MKNKRKYNRYQIGIRVAVISGLLALIVLSFALELLFAGGL